MHCSLVVALSGIGTVLYRNSLCTFPTKCAAPYLEPLGHQLTSSPPSRRYSLASAVRYLRQAACRARHTASRTLQAGRTRKPLYPAQLGTGASQSSPSRSIRLRQGQRSPRPTRPAQRRQGSPARALLRMPMCVARRSSAEHVNQLEAVGVLAGPGVKLLLHQNVIGRLGPVQEHHLTFIARCIEKFQKRLWESGRAAENESDVSVQGFVAACPSTGRGIHQ